MEVGRSEVLGASWQRASSCEYPVVFLCPHPPAGSPRSLSSAFRLQPVKALEMNFAISSEMTQVRRCTRAPREEEGGVGRWWLCGASGCPRRNGHRGAPHSCGYRLAGGRARLSRTFPHRGGDRQASVLGDGGPQDLAQRTARKDDRPDESSGHRGLWASFPAVRSGCRLRVGALRAKTPRDRRVGTRSRPQSASAPGVKRGVVPSPWSPWTAGSFVPSPRCPLFLPSAGEKGGGRSEGAAALTCQL